MNEAERLTLRYVFGTEELSANWRDYNDHIRTPKSAATYSVNADDLLNGGGKYAVLSKISVVERFFSASLADGVYSYAGKDEHFGAPTQNLQQALGISPTAGWESRSTEFSHYVTDVTSQDYASRAWMLGTAGYYVQDANFICTVVNGVKTIVSAHIGMQGDNFDFETRNGGAAALNYGKFRPEIDPYHMGQKTEIIYTGVQARTYSNYTIADYEAEKEKWATSQQISWSSETVTAVVQASEFYNALKQNDFLSYRRDGYVVQYGSSGNDTIIAGQVPVGAPPGNLGAQDKFLLVGGAGDDIVGGSVNSDRLLGGDGNDILKGGIGADTLLGGTGDDELDGGPGTDVLEGGLGFDTYRIKPGPGVDFIKDEDGQGQVDLGGVIVRGGTLKQGDLFWSNDSDGSRYAIVADGLLWIDRPGTDPVFIENWQNGDLGITLSLPDDAPPGPGPGPGPTPPPPPTQRDPLVIDIDGDGYNGLRTANGSITFDHNADGVRTATGWVGANEAFVVFDKNGNGVIDSGRELFGQDTLKQDGSFALNGFDALADLDTNRNGIFESTDAAFNQIQLWRDLDQNGMTSADELQSLSVAGVKGIALTYNAFGAVVEGNTLSWKAGVELVDGSTRTVAAIDFAQTLATGPETFESVEGQVPVLPEALSLPNVDSMGMVRSLREACSLNGPESAVLKSLVRDFSTAEARSTRLDLVDELIFAWGETAIFETSIDTSSYLSRTSAGAGSKTAVQAWAEQNPLLFKQAEAMERFRGSRMLERWVVETAGGHEISQLHPEFEINWKNFSAGIYSALVLQTHLKPYLEAVSVTHGAESSTLSGDRLLALLEEKRARDSVGALSDLVELRRYALPTLVAAGIDSALLLSDWVAASAGEPAFKNELDALGFSSGLTAIGLRDRSGHIGGQGYQVVRIFGSQNLVRLGDGGSLVTVSGDYNEVIAANGSDNVTITGNLSTVRAGEGNDSITANGDSVQLFGEGGTDDISSGSGDDTLAGGAGNDWLSDTGLTSDDTYLYGVGDGIDYIVDRGGRNTIRFGAGISEADVKVKFTSTEMVIGIGESGWVHFGGNASMTEGTQSGTYVDSFEFANGQSWSSEKIFQESYQPTNGDDFILGTRGNDFLDGGSGNDTIWGADGNDSILGSAGRDVLWGGRGNDTLDAGLGADNDVLHCGEGNDLARAGEASRSTMLGEAGDDTLVGGISMDGGAGSDTFVIGGSTQTIEEASEAGADNDVVVFGDNIRPADVKLDHQNGSLLIHIGTDRTISVANFFVKQGKYSIEAFEFADGTKWTPEYIYSKLTGATENPDEISGFSWAETLVGDGGDDSLFGGAGNDTLIGGTGSDWLTGGEGDDTYYFAENFGDDVIEQRARPGTRTDTIKFSAAIEANSVTLARDRDHLVVAAGAQGSITIRDYFVENDGRGAIDCKISQITFADGTIWSGSLLSSLIASPAVTYTTADGQITAITSSSYALADGEHNVVAEGGKPTRLMGNNLNNRIVGNSHNNVLNGSDLLDLAAGAAPESAGMPVRTGIFSKVAGEDTLVGGLGDDVYHINSEWAEGTEASAFSQTNDVVVEEINGGYDTVVTTSYNEILSSNVESLIAHHRTRWWYTANNESVWHSYSGNELNNIIDATDVFGETRIDGGSGSDTMSGDAEGVNVYVVDSVGDVIREEESVYKLRNNIVESFISFSLQDHEDVRTLRLMGSEAVVANGSNMDDELDGSGNSSANLLVGMGGDDTLTLGRDDIVDEKSGGGTDTLVFAYLGDHFVSSFLNVENARLDASAESSSLVGTIESNSLIGNQSSNQIRGEGGNDYLRDGDFSGKPAAADELFGGDGNDTIIAFGGRVDWDVLSGGRGNDVLQISGAAEFRFSSGDGHDTIYILDANYDCLIKIDSTVDAASLRLERHSKALVLKLSNGQDSLTIEDYFVDDVSTVPRLPYVALTVGDVQDVYLTDLLRMLTSDAAGTQGAPTDDALIGTETGDDIAGLDGSDIIWGRAGDDSIAGGRGADTIHSGMGDDTLVYRSGDGSDRIYDTGGLDRIKFVGGIRPEEISFSRIERDLYINLLDGSTIVVADFMSADERFEIEHFEFESGEVLSGARVRELASRVSGTEQADNIDGSTFTDVIFGLGGNDSIYGNGGDDTLDGGIGTDRLEGGDGDDVYIVDSASDNTVEYLEGGFDTVISSVSLTLRANVENLKLAESSALNGTGNSVDNVIAGNARNNTLSGLAGRDTMIGGLGDDIYVVDNVLDSAVERFSEGLDTVQSSVSFSLSTDVENLVLTGAVATSGVGNALANALTGNAAANKMFGFGGNDSLSGGGGADTLTGGAGDDIYVVDSADDIVEELLGEGVDLVKSSSSYSISDNIENLTLTGSAATTATGNSLDNIIVGNSANNKLIGGAGNDSLSGESGNDTMFGGLGDDVYTVNVAGDVVSEAGGEGIDLVLAAVNYTLGSNVESVTLFSTALSATGNSLDNALMGNALANTLTGGAGNDTLNGGAGADTLVGEGGDDLYVVDNVLDVIKESATSGIDSVASSLSWSLSSNLENLSLTGSSDTNATGNAAGNRLSGNSGNNILKSLGGDDTLDGGSGADSLIGGDGSDIYLMRVGAGWDVVQEDDVAQGAVDAVEFGVGISRGDVTFFRDGADLMGRIAGGADGFTVTRWFDGSQFQVEEFRFADGNTILSSQVQNLVDAMGVFSAGAGAAAAPTFTSVNQTPLAASAML